jgi:DNA helicase-4
MMNSDFVLNASSIARRHSLPKRRRSKQASERCCQEVIGARFPDWWPKVASGRSSPTNDRDPRRLPELGGSFNRNSPDAPQVRNANSVCRRKSVSGARETAQANARLARERQEAERARQEQQAREAEQERARLARQREEADRARQERRRQFLLHLQKLFLTDILSADAEYSVHPDRDLVPRDEFERLATQFVQEWAARELGEQLDTEQAAAVASTGANVQVIARAGSGKTRTLVTRAMFLQRHCRVSPRELLLLASNKKAAEEMKERLAKKLGANLPHVMTFHALAHALVHPDEDLLYDDTSAEHFGLSREIQVVIDEYIRSDEYGGLIRDLMLAHFREDWERIVEGGLHLTIEEFLEHRRSLPRETLKGDFVKSYGERVIANALFEHDVDYRYEQNFRWDGINYRPDFTIQTGLKGGVIIEYFGLASDPDYDERSEAKRRFWAERDQWTFLEYTPVDLARLGEAGFVERLVRDLQAAGIRPRPLSDEDVWQRVRDRGALYSFTSAMRTFVGRCRKHNLSPDDLAGMVQSHSACSTAEELFLEVGTSIYRAYLERLIARGKEDFDGLMWRAVEQVRAGGTRFKRDGGREQGDLRRLRFVMIDEFQDFSPMFHELIEAVRRACPGVQLFCVGDDWQAINGFAGSELSFFRDFASHFAPAVQRHIRTNYRSPQSVVEVGNALMMGRGPRAAASQMKVGSVWLCRLDTFQPSMTEQARHNGDEITPAALRLVRWFLDRGLNVVMLSRRNGIPWYVDLQDRRAREPDGLDRFLRHVLSFLPEEDRGRVSISTAHRYKGREEDAVILLDAVKRSYPLIHPNWVFTRIFGDTIERLVDEERRLFYVALTRAKDTLALVTDSLTESPFLADLSGAARPKTLDWATPPPAASLDAGWVEVRISGNTYPIKEHLNRSGYSWKSYGKFWCRAFIAEGFTLDAVTSQPWFTHGLQIRVYSETGQLLQQEWR